MMYSNNDYNWGRADLRADLREALTKKHKAALEVLGERLLACDRLEAVKDLLPTDVFEVLLRDKNEDVVIGTAYTKGLFDALKVVTGA